MLWGPVPRVIGPWKHLNHYGMGVLGLLVRELQSEALSVKHCSYARLIPI